MKHLDQQDEIFEYSEESLGDRKSEVDAIFKELQTVKEYGQYDMLLCKLESILKERKLID